MFNLLESLETVVQPLNLNQKILEIAYEMFLQAPQSDYPVINLNRLSQQTGASVWDCRNAIVFANKVGKFPRCALSS